MLLLSRLRLLRAAQSHAESGHDLVEDQQGAMTRGYIP